MKENKFRGKRVDNGKWIKGGLLYSNDNDYFIVTIIAYRSDENNVDVFESYRVISETVGQYAEFKDCEGCEIYEGDIVFILYTIVHSDPIPIKGIVKFDQESKGFYISTDNNYMKYLTFDEPQVQNTIEKIGNNFDHSKLMEG